ncbi:hypothetical protein ACEWY4_007242 [Coilia grayii]|uniref:C3H1-type domain-containing protein n=1 Tax=Coilia grayii TaxID=363190 RepID=A0ABD1KFQ3_9TELE
MNSLVCYGVSSDSDSDSDVNKCHQEAEGKGGKIETKKERNFLLESGSASSDSEAFDEDGDEEDTSKDTQIEPLTPIKQHIVEEPTPLFASTEKANKLPPPPLGVSGGLVGSSVFANPFKEQADERLNVLQKHVPLTLQARPTQIGGKKICIAYRKDGRCRFGSRCKYAHDSDLQNTAALASTAGSEEGTEACSDQTGPTQATSQTPDCQTPSLFKQGEEEDGPEEERTKKRRVGLSETLVPPKRALKQFNMQRQKERYTPF